MKRTLSLILGLLTVWCGVSTAAKDRKTPIPDTTRGAIGVTIRVKGPTPLSAPTNAINAYFVRVKENGRTGIVTKIWPASFSEGNQVYLLNAEPGEYVVVAAYASARTVGRSRMPATGLYFDEESIQATAVTVEAGRIAFMGQIVAKIGFNMKNADAAQTFYRDLIGGARGPYTPVRLESLDRDSKTASDFWKRAVKDAFKNEPGLTLG